MAALLTRYRTIDAVFEETPNERLLREACEGLDPFDEDEQEEIYDDIMDAIDLPDTVAGLWQEYYGWNQLIDDRLAFTPDYDTPDGIFYRMQILEDLLDKVPARSFQDIMARLSWMETIARGRPPRDPDDDVGLVGRLRDDVTDMYRGMGGS